MSVQGQATIHLKVVTPLRLLVETDVESLALPSLEGEIGILPGHRPLFVGIGRGRIRFRANGEGGSMAVLGGYAQVQPEKVVVVTDVDENDEGSGAADA